MKAKKVIATLLAVSMLVGVIPGTSVNSVKATDAESGETVISDTVASYATADVTSELGRKDLVYMDACGENPLMLHGLLSQDGAPYARMDMEVALEVAKSTEFSKISMYTHMRESAGGRIRFTTNSPYVAVKAAFPYFESTYATEMGAGKYSFDVYVDTEEGSTYYGTISPKSTDIPTANKEWGYEGIVEFDTEEVRNITIYFPTTQEVSEVYVGAKSTSVVTESLASYEDVSPIVFYGSSITQGGNTTRPGLTYVNAIGRMLNRDYINLGTWGSCHAETAMMNYIASLDMSMFVYDYDHNAANADELTANHYAGYEIVRAAHPDIPIIFVTRPNQNGDWEANQTVIRANYEQAVAAGDENVYYIDGQTIFNGDATCLSDGIHPSDKGQAKMAEVIGGQLQGIIEAMPAEEPAYNETVLLTDTFDDGTSWDTTVSATKNAWRLNSASLAGPRDGKATLGYTPQGNRNLYSSRTNDGKLTDVYMKADVTVTSAICHGDHPQCHYLLARASTASAADGIVFGLKTLKGATKSSLVIANYDGKDTTVPLYETEAVYDFNTAYTLELFVVDQMVIAKCNGTVIFSQIVENANSGMGYCGLIDRRACSEAVEGVTKGGYFDNFSISTIAFDGFEVDGNVVCESDGSGIADITVSSGDKAVATIEDVSVTAVGFHNKQANRYDYKQLVKTILSGATQVATAETVYVISDVSNAVTSLSDSRWTGASATAKPRFTVDGNGVATLTPSGTAAAGLSVLNAGTENGAYGNFYAEYTMTVSNLADEARGFYDTFLCVDSYGATSGNAWQANLFYDNRASQAPKKTFWGRLVGASTTNFSDTVADTDIGVGMPLNVGMLIYDKTITLFLNETQVATYTGTVNISGWFGIAQSGPAGSVKIEDFMYIPLADKALADIEVAATSKIQLGETFIPSVTPVYTWPNAKDEAVTEGVTVTGFDNTKLGTQYVTVTYEGIEKEIKVEVVNYESVVCEDFTENPFGNKTDWASSSNMTVADGVATAPNSANASAYLTEKVSDGFIETTIILDEPNASWDAAASKTSIYPATLSCQKVIGKTDADLDITAELRVRFSVTKGTDGAYTAGLQTLIAMNRYDGGPYYANGVTLNDFVWGQPYTIRLSFIGNYVETIVNGEVKVQTTIPENLGMKGIAGKVGFSNSVSGNGTVAVTLDNFEVGRYTTYAVDTTDTKVTLPEYFDITSSKVFNQRDAFLPGEEVILTVTPEEGYQLAAAGGLTYQVGDVTYVVEDRVGDAGKNTEISNQFVIQMPASDIKVTDKYVADTAANMGIRSTSIREKQGELKSGIRFSSRAYKQYTTTEDVTYTLKEVGTLIFKEGTEITQDVLNGCYESNGSYMIDSAVIGKKVAATRSQDICDEYIDWGLVLTYEDGSTLFDVAYTAYSYALYETTDGDTEVVFAENPKTYSYNGVAEKLGYALQ